MRQTLLITIFFTSIFSGQRKFKIGLCISATNKYIKFVTPLLRTARILFLKNHDVYFYIFTDKDYSFDEKTITIKVAHRPWPLSTLLRFENYHKNKDKLQHMDYLFACDADMLFLSKVDEKELLNDLVGVIHPYFWNDFSKGKLEYEKNPASTAYIKDEEGKHYYAGGFYGGKREEFFKLMNVTLNNIYKDLQKNLIAKWHDESHLNRYFIDNAPTKTLNSSYCYPQYFFNHPQKDFNFKKILVALEKDHNVFRY